MPLATSSTPFIVTHASGLHAVAHHLNRLHQETFRVDGDGPQRSVRLSVLNLVAACITEEDADIAMQTVGNLAQSHPARAIIVIADPDNANEGIEADLSLQCVAIGDGQVCAEQVRLSVHGEAAYHLASVVTPLLVPDIPVYLWLVGSPPLRQAFGHDAIAICERLIIDSGGYPDVAQTMSMVAVALGQRGDAVGIADLAWERIRTWREHIAQVCDGPELTPFVHRIVQLDVECCGRQPSTQAWLLAGWFADRLSWDDAGPQVSATAAEVDGVPEHDLSAVRISCSDGDHHATVTVERREKTLYTTIAVDGGTSASRAMGLDSPEIVNLVGGLLEDSQSDPTYPGALRQAVRQAART